VCISPWNFPLAIFTGEISAALAAGNVVLAKPAEQTPLIARRAVELLHAAGIPTAALQFLPGQGGTVGARLVADARVCGVIFTGSTEVAQLINQTLAKRAVAEAREIPLIAETGGQNAMIVDSSALPEQVVQDAIQSAFDSAGQRCSALRVLCVQEDIADRVLKMLKGAMQELAIGVPDRLSVDVGPVIDDEARGRLQRHVDHMQTLGKKVFQLPLPAASANGTFIAPTVIEIASLSELTSEVFGPVLHVLRYRRDQLPELVKAINATGYGLTLGVHSRIDETIGFITSQAHVGNIYVNRNIVGAVVGVQPFGGEGKSGTGPKAGGPLYLKRLQRHPDATLPAVKTSIPAFDDLCAWLKKQEDPSLSALATAYAKKSPLGAVIALPGPTGETNTLSFAPRGAVLCGASTLAALLNQLAAVTATGNSAVIDKEASLLIPADLPPTVIASIRVIDSISTSSSALHFALLETSTVSSLVPLLATRDDALVSWIETSATAAIPLWRLAAERAVCINTTAAGGNASLMTLQA
ncbi:MAG TPA: L-glutamate gamma-semialdehyde dehydrogenase, partial [Noviherbaspirillum sp.]|uniref:L-glutamate gamma-semialdehyde dehydrogenase n=1 Tax=Noviherbaspirillum sp. TaxID=1926288 RepID=UPI002DDCD5C9